MLKKRKKNTKGNLVLRYPDKDESVWSIAKFYGTTNEYLLSDFGKAYLKGGAK